MGIRSTWSFPTLHTSEETLFQIGLNLSYDPKIKSKKKVFGSLNKLGGKTEAFFIEAEGDLFWWGGGD